MDSTNEEEDTALEIDKTLLSIKNIFFELKRELQAINELVKMNSDLHSSVTERLLKIANQMGIEQKVLDNAQDIDFAAVPTDPINIAEKLLSCFNG